MGQRLIGSGGCRLRRRRSGIGAVVDVPHRERRRSACRRRSGILSRRLYGGSQGAAGATVRRRRTGSERAPTEAYRERSVSALRRPAMDLSRASLMAGVTRVRVGSAGAGAGLKLRAPRRLIGSGGGASASPAPGGGIEPAAARTRNMIPRGDRLRMAAELAPRRRRDRHHVAVGSQRRRPRQPRSLTPAAPPVAVAVHRPSSPVAVASMLAFNFFFLPPDHVTPRTRRTGLRSPCTRDGAVVSELASRSRRRQRMPSSASGVVRWPRSPAPARGQPCTGAGPAWMQAARAWTSARRPDRACTRRRHAADARSA